MDAGYFRISFLGADGADRMVVYEEIALGQQRIGCPASGIRYLVSGIEHLVRKSVWTLRIELVDDSSGWRRGS